MKALVLLNHNLTGDQVKELKQMGATEIVTAPDWVKEPWRSVPPEIRSEEELVNHLAPVLSWLDNTGAPNDLLVVQGEFAATTLVSIYAAAKNIKPIMATTRREVVEKKQPDGSVQKQAIFKHVTFREYPLKTLMEHIPKEAKEEIVNKIASGAFRNFRQAPSM